MPNSQFQLAYQVSPIILIAGIAEQVPGGMLPINFLFTGISGNAIAGSVLPYDPTNLDNAFGAFNVLPGGTLVSQSIAKYPFCNQYVAANAVIREPITVSVIMDAPMRGSDAWGLKLTTFNALKATLDSHNNAGGTYVVCTPAHLYDNLIMTALTDNSRGNNSLPQNAWRFDFERPLVAAQELQTVQSIFMQKITNQVPTTTGVSGIQTGLTSGQSYLNPGTPMPAVQLEVGVPIPYSQITALIGGGGLVDTGSYQSSYPTSGQSGSPFAGVA